MTAFHTDEYINFLARVTPETAEELTHGGMLCACHSSRLIFGI
jgi:histone deacetylase 1/2